MATSDQIALALIIAFVAVFAASLQYHWLTDRRRERRRAQFDSSYAGRVLERIRRARRTTLLLVPARQPGFSKLGGLPELPDDLAWPAGDEEPRRFIVQIDLATFQAHTPMDWLPDAGRLYAFIDEERNGAADCVRILYSGSLPGAPAQPPAGKRSPKPFRERRVGFLPLKSAPSPDWLEVDPAGLGDFADDEEMAEFGQTDWHDEIEHRIGGYPSEIQGGQMQIECEYLHRGRTRHYEEPVPDSIRRAARQWRLLLQIDSDPELGMNWWDSGRLYVFVRKRDARQGDFSRTVTITQTY